MTNKQQDRRRRQLETLRNRMRTDAAQAAEETHGPSGGQHGGDLSNAPWHMADEGSDEFLFDVSAALAENAAYLHQEVDDALKRLDDGRYGKCETCGKSIAGARLDALPFVRDCIDCAATNSSGLSVNVNEGRPRTPADTLAPEGSMEEGWRPMVEAAGGSGRNVQANDEHAAGEPGGGSAIGGLAGSNSGGGDPEVSDLQDAAGSGEFDFDGSRDETPETPHSGRSGGAVGGTPARKRSS
jgi:RNA polymerase-binding transcription factor DksA